jgi:uncharacterized protein
MSLETKIMEDLKEAMKAKDQATMRGIRAIKSAILLFKTDGSGSTLDEVGEIKILQKLIKQRQDSFDIYVKQNRQDLADVEKDEINVIMKYLPKQLSGEELELEIKKIISDIGVSSVKDMGRVMAESNKILAGKADGKSISDIVKKILN